jgi:hypothetical protein
MREKIKKSILHDFNGTVKDIIKKGCHKELFELGFNVQVTNDQ